ncbi:hypothetical protein KSAC_32850 (plasmid) [Komagataeibacter saccharivorans]|nr:hypothetical protein KSAC_32850 [Komagataeibacter saccharivorans]
MIKTVLNCLRGTETVTNRGFASGHTGEIRNSPCYLIRTSLVLFAGNTA